MNINEEIRDRECPECNKKYMKSFLKLYQINLNEAIYMCPITTCKYPKGYEIIYVKRDIIQDDTNILTEDTELADSNSKNSLDKINKAIGRVEFNRNTDKINNSTNNAHQTENCTSKLNGKIKVLSDETVNFPIIDINNIIKNCNDTKHVTARPERDGNKEEFSKDNHHLHSAKRQIENFELNQVQHSDSTNCKTQKKSIDKQERRTEVFNKTHLPIKITYPKLQNVTMYDPKNSNMKNLTANNKITPQALKTMNKLVNADKKVKICFIDNSDNSHKFKIKTDKCNRSQLTREQLSSSISAALAATKETDVLSSAHKKRWLNFKRDLFKKRNEDSISNSRVSKFEGFTFEAEPESTIDKVNPENITADLHFLHGDCLENINELNQILSTLNTDSNHENTDALNCTANIDENILNEVLKEVNAEKNKSNNYEVEDVDDWLKSLIS